MQLIVVTSDRGLAGAFNSNLFEAAQRFIERASGASLEVEAIGRKGRDYFRRTGAKLTGEHVGVIESPATTKRRALRDA